MIHTIAGCQLTEHLYESTNSLVFRGRRMADDQLIIIKMLKEAFAPPERIAWFKREYELTRSLHMIGVPQVYALVTEQNHWLMLQEDFGGESLTRLKLAGKLSLKDFLDLAIAITDILGHIHQHHVMHKDINPSNIVLNPTTGVVKIIDFGIATVLSRKTPSFRNPNVLEGTLAYMSPEQTGRMNRAIDYRTDFYSLGCTFYELLTEQRPFMNEDPLELVHCHIARQPLPPHTLNTAIPQELSDIILKLMDKNAEDRYQSAYGIKSDLSFVAGKKLVVEQPVDLLSNTPQGQSFTPGLHDVSREFQISQKLYGREREITYLLDTFEYAQKGTSEFMLISGPAGIGKTALVQEIYRPVTRQHGFFATGKCDQFQRNVGYYVFIQAFQGLIRYLLTESDDRIAEWRTKLLTALGPNGQVMVDIIPDLALIIGPQPAPPQLEPAEVQNRFLMVFQQMVEVLAHPAHPLVLFLDDIQWADGASLKLIEYLVNNTHLALLIIGVYRDNEVRVGHPLWLTVEAINKSQISIHEVRLEPLDVEAITHLVADTLHCTEDDARPLAELVQVKTDGNPFFVQEFLTSLYWQKLIWFDGGIQGDTADAVHIPKWHWDMARIQTQTVTENVVDLMNRRVQRLPEHTKMVLKQAACIRNQFALETLTLVSDMSPTETAQALEQALIEGFIIPLDDMYKVATLETPGLEERVHVTYRFAHDRIQQMLYELIPVEEQQALHWHIGKCMRIYAPKNRDYYPNSSSERAYFSLFDIVYHLNEGRMLASTQAERDDLAELNAYAARCAKASAAYQPAFAYLKTSIELLWPPDHTQHEIICDTSPWQRQYHVTLRLYVEAAETACLVGDENEVERLTNATLAQARTVLDKVQVYEVQLQMLMAQNRYREVIATACSVLALLGVTFPEDPTTEDVGQELAQIDAALAERTIESLMHLPPMTDPYMLAATRILGRIIAAAYGTQAMFALIVLRQVHLSMLYGNARQSPFAYAGYGILLCGVVGDIDRGYEAGQLALRLVDKLDAKDIATRTKMAVNFTIRHWKEPIRDILPSFLETYQLGLETGDPTHACYSLYHLSYMHFQIGTELEYLEPLMREYTQVIHQLKQQAPFVWMSTLHQTVLNIQGASENPCLLQGEVFDETVMQAKLEDAQDATSLFLLYLCKSILCYLFGHYEQAFAWIQQTHVFRHGAISLPYNPVASMYDSLIRLALLDAGDATGDATNNDVSNDAHVHAVLKQVEENQAQMQVWAQHAPANVLSKYELVEAEYAWVCGRYGDAREHFDAAIALAQKYGYVNEEALAYERAGMFYLARGQPQNARLYLRNARYAYLRWGAMAKVQTLEKHYPTITEKKSTVTEHDVLITSPSSVPSKSLDFASVIKAGQAISDELVLDKLLAMLMRIIMENAGADHGVLLLDTSGQWLIEAESTLDTTDVTVLQSTLPTHDVVPFSVLHYVSHTREYVVLHNAPNEGQFVDDAYVKIHLPLSILCVPLLHQRTFIGMLYLENRMSSGAFTEDRLEVIHVLSTQAAISIVQARLYARLAERTDDLLHTNAMLQDEIAERKRVEEALQQAKNAAEVANRVKSAFLAKMSHELRTPLTAILGFTQLIGNDTSLSPTQRENLSVVDRSGHYLLSLINDILEMSKIESGQVNVHEQPFDIHRLIANLTEMFSMRAFSKGLQFTVMQDPSVPRYVYADESKARQVLVNLLSNAVKFTEKGSIMLHVSLAQETDNAPDVVSEEATHVPNDTYMLHVEVEDTGIGIADEDMHDIFEAFIQTSSDKNKQHMPSGAGLGLPISQHFVRMMGGTITVSSTVGQGSLFACAIPVKVLADHVPKHRDSAVAAGTGEDDDEIAREIGVIGTQSFAAPAQLPNDALDHTPIAWRQNLKLAATLGDIDMLSSVIEEARRWGDASLADNLENLADSFCFDVIVGLAKHGESD